MKTMALTSNRLLQDALDRNDWYGVSEIASIGFIRDNPSLPYDMEALSKNPDAIDVVLGVVLLPNATGRWNWRYASRNHDASTILDNPHLPWNRDMMSENEDYMGGVLSLDQEGGLPYATGAWRF